MEETEFNDKYWYGNTKLVIVENPRDEDYVFRSVVSEGVDPMTGRMRETARTYRVKAHSSERFVGTIANLYLDQMTKLLAQDEEKIHFLIDFQLRAQYYDRLTVEVTDLIHDYQPVKEYLNGAEETEVTAPVEQPFAGAKETNEEPVKTAKAPVKA